MFKRKLDDLIVLLRDQPLFFEKGVALVQKRIHAMTQLCIQYAQTVDA